MTPSMGVRRRVVGLGIGAALLFAAAGMPTKAAEPEAGTVDRGHPETRWSGSTVAQTAGLSGAGCITAAPDPTCDFFTLNIGDLSQKQRLRRKTLANDVQVAITAPAGLNEYDLYVYGPDGAEVARATTIGSAEAVIVQNPPPGAYTVAVQNVLSSDPAAGYDGVARRINASTEPAPLDDPTPCGFESSPEVRELDSSIGAGALVGDPAAALDGLDTGQPVSLDVFVILDGVPQADAEAIFAKAARSYAPLNIQLRAVRFVTHTFATDEAAAIIAGAKSLVGGKRPADVDIVEILTSKDIQQLGRTEVAGLADCIGGVAHDDRAFVVAEARTEENVLVGPVMVSVDATANVTAHEVGHLMGGQHHYGNCVEGVQGSDVHDDEGYVEASPCTLMFNAANFLGPNFSTLNAAIVRSHAVRHALP
jgi:hypothetical protein